MAKAPVKPSTSTARPVKRTIKVDQHKSGYDALGFRSASVTARDGRTYIAGSGEAHQKYDRKKLIAQSRIFYYDNAIYSGLIERAVSYIAGDVALQSNHPNKNHNAKVEKLWKNFWEKGKPEVRGILSGDQVIKMICRELLVAGDTGAIKTNQNKLQLIEAEQIAGKIKDDAKDGIKKDTYGKPQSYYVCPYNRGGQPDTRNAKPYKPADFLFVTDPKRPSSVRSVPPSQASFPMLHRINDVCDSEAIAMQMLSRIAVSITREMGPEQAYEESVEDPNKTEDEVASMLTELGTALIFHGEPGDDIQGVNHNIPGKDFGESIKMFLRLLGLPLGLPLEVILLDWTQSNYSQSRAVLEQAYQMFKARQKILKTMFLSEVFNWKYAHWVIEGLITDRKGGDAHEWILPTFPWLDQLKEAQAHAAKLDRTMTTHTAVCKSQGLDREDVVNTRVREIEDAIERAKKTEEKTGIKVPWQALCGMDPSGGSVNLSEIDTSDDKKQKPQNNVKKSRTK